MEQVQEQKFVCKFCNKCCLSGKALGGHMRCHLALILAAKKEKVKADIKLEFGGDGVGDQDHDDYGLEEDYPKNSCRVSAKQCNSSLNQVKVEAHSSMNLGSDDQDQDSYGLRENPKKSWKASSDLRACRAPGKVNLCKECGKSFPSSRALAGHMRAHSAKLKDRHLCEKCGKGFDSQRAMFGHMKSHSKRSRVSSESADGLSDFDIVYPRKKRSLIRYKFSQSFSLSSAIVSSSVNEIEEIKTAAMCLMMLSRGVTNWDEFKCSLDYTDIATSIDFEVKSFPHHKGMTKIDGDDFECNPDEVDNPENPTEELHSPLSWLGNSLSKLNVSELNDLGSQFASGNEKKAEREVCAAEHLCNGKFKKSRHVDVSGIELNEPKNKRASDSAGVERCKDQNEAVEIDQKVLLLVDLNPCKKVKFNAHDRELEGNSSDVAKCDDTIVEILKDSEKKREYKCRICNMIFRSHQALGGHSNRHKILGNCSALSTESSHLSDSEFNESSTETVSHEAAITGSEITKSKDHECPTCFKVFPTGQALGGHKRAHYVGFSESRIKETTVERQELNDIQSTFDLNLPAIGRDGEVGLKAWWAGSGHDPEPLVISN